MFYRIWSKVIILNAPPLRDTSPTQQNLVDDNITEILKLGPKAFKYNLSFCTLFDNWGDTKIDYLRYNK